MPKAKFSIADRDQRVVAVLEETSHRTAAIWALDCAQRVLPYFERAAPEDHRPQQALDTLQRWIDTGEFSMAVIRKASLGAHAAAREVGEDNAARSAARAAGQAAATAHVQTHAIGGAVYALQAIHRASSALAVEAALAQEREWQYQHLLELRQISSPVYQERESKGD